MEDVMGMMVHLLILLYSAFRIYLVVECFIGIPRLPSRLLRQHRGYNTSIKLGSTRAASQALGILVATGS